MNFHALRVATGVFLSLVLHAAGSVHYVDVNSANPTTPYLDWSTAATNIQGAVDVAVAGEKILVTNGVYATGGRVVYGALTNRVAVTKPLTVQSVNGPVVTVIQGNGPIGTNAVRCVYLTNNAVLIGFTLTNGATRNLGDSIKEQSGGGALCESTNSLLLNCLVVSNTAQQRGGGIECGTCNNSKLFANMSEYGGAEDNGILNNCVVVANSSLSGAIQNGISRNCTIVSNSAGATDGKLFNCVIYYNSGGNFAGSRHTNCCTTPLPPGQGNFTNAPLFSNAAAGDFHLQTNSPCINAGNNAYAAGTTDLDDNPRISGGTVDIGAYEIQSPASVISYAWLQKYGLSTDGSADYADSDGDGMNNWQEWSAGTNPTNALSVLKMLAPSNAAPGITVTWQSVAAITYYLQRSTNLTGQPTFTSQQSNIVGQAVTTAYTDTNVLGGGPFFYRVGVQH